MWYNTCMQGNQGDSWLLMVVSQIIDLIPDPSFGHNVCFKYPNGSCKHILNIYILKTFEWYKELFNPMSVNLYNLLLKIWESIGTPTVKIRAHLVVWGFIPSLLPALLKTWNVTLKLHFWPTPLQAFALVTSPILGLWQ